MYTNRSSSHFEDMFEKIDNTENVKVKQNIFCSFCPCIYFLLPQESYAMKKKHNVLRNMPNFKFGNSALKSEILYLMI